MKLVSSKERYRTKIFWVTEDHAVGPDGREMHRDIVQHAGSAVMMAVDDRKRILLVKQYRLPARASLWELPAGRLDEGETALKAAKRELREETGVTAKSWKKLVSYYPSPGYVAEKMTLFVATELQQGEPEPMDDEEGMESRWFTAKELEEAIETGKIVDGKTIVGFLMWKRFGTRL
jgi:ADP-ribose pyrophosphatase